MMAGSRLPLVSNDLLLLPDRPGEQQAQVIVGSDVWYTWLASESARWCTFRRQLGTFTARGQGKRIDGAGIATKRDSSNSTRLVLVGPESYQWSRLIS